MQPAMSPQRWNQGLESMSNYSAINNLGVQVVDCTGRATHR
nr:hypothetical protein JVH1_9168 [Rhodococcus sp. JVH1]